MSNPIRTAFALSIAALVSSVALSAGAQQPRRRHATQAPASRPSPITFHVTPEEGSLRWSFALANTSAQPVEVLADRRLVWIELLAGSPESSTAPAGTQRRATRLVRCIAPGRPDSNEGSPRRLLHPGARYIEAFDLREICGLHLPSWLVPGASLRMHYGFGSASGALRAVVFDSSLPYLSDIAMAEPVTVLGALASWPPRPPLAERGDARLEVSVANTPRAATGEGLQVRVRIRNAGVHPIRVFWRPGMVRFTIVDPSGRRTECTGGFREYAPIRDFFVRLGRGASVGSTLQLGALCPRETFAQPGIYLGQAVFESRTDGAEFGFASFVGASRSAFFYLHVTRGDTGVRYRALPAGQGPATATMNGGGDAGTDPP